MPPELVDEGRPVTVIPLLTHALAPVRAHAERDGDEGTEVGHRDEGSDEVEQLDGRDLFGEEPSLRVGDARDAVERGVPGTVTRLTDG